MRPLLQYRPSPSLAVAIAAVVLASTGSAIAAKKITSMQIKDGTIELKDLSPGIRKALKRGRGPQGPAGPIGAPGALGPAGQDAVRDVGLSAFRGHDKIITGEDKKAITELEQTVRIPAGQTRRLLVTLSGESKCSSTTPDFGHCSVRILVDEDELRRADDRFFAWASPGGSYEVRSLQGYSENLASGAHIVTVEVRNFGAQTTLTIDESVLSVMQVPAT